MTVPFQVVFDLPFLVTFVRPLVAFQPAWLTLPPTFRSPPKRIICLDETSSARRGRYLLEIQKEIGLPDLRRAFAQGCSARVVFRYSQVQLRRWHVIWSTARQLDEYNDINMKSNIPCIALS